MGRSPIAFSKQQTANSKPEKYIGIQKRKEGPKPGAAGGRFALYFCIICSST
jgi:hypothetical protein